GERPNEEHSGWVGRASARAEPSDVHAVRDCHGMRPSDSQAILLRHRNNAVHPSPGVVLETYPALELAAHLPIVLLLQEVIVEVQSDVLFYDGSLRLSDIEH